MADENPYQTPQARVEDTVDDQKGIEDVRTGQRLVIFAVLLNLLSIVLSLAALAILTLPLQLVTLVMSFMGVLRVARGFGMSTLAKAGLVILMFVPLVNLVTLVVLSSRATSRLRGAGYKVGLMGARAKAQ
ncbi:MAG TPA: hypothetical protein VHP37_27950 [Burkholderiales bacterium]|nr:hypothetical protein [Burkholderiales bacterium]